MVEALSYLHSRGVLYRDLKPENVLFDREGHTVLIDFGLAKTGMRKDVKSYSFCGTPEYLAPEIVSGVGHDQQADWYSLGCLLYEMIHGKPPFYTQDKELMVRNRIQKPF